MDKRFPVIDGDGYRCGYATTKRGAKQVAERKTIHLVLSTQFAPGEITLRDGTRCHGVWITKTFSDLLRENMAKEGRDHA